MIEVIQALSVLTELSKAYQEMYQIIQQAKARGRDINPDELLIINDRYEASFDNLDAAIEEAGKEKDEADNN